MGQKRLYVDNAVYFVTSDVQNRASYFQEPIFCEVFIENLRKCKFMKECEIYAFVVVRNHFHIMVLPKAGKELSKIMQFLKRHISRDINFILGHTTEEEIGQSLLRVGEEAQPRLQLGKGDAIHEKIIQNHQEKINELKREFVIKYGESQTTFPKFQWQKSFYDHYIRNEDDFSAHVQYILRNPFHHKVPMPKTYQYIFTNYPDLINSSSYAKYLDPNQPQNRKRLE